MEQFLRARKKLSDQLLRSFRDLPAATVHEAAGKVGAMDHAIRPMAAGLRLCGRALTVRGQSGDNLTLHAAIALAQPDDVIVADVGGFLDSGHWGEIMTVAAQARRIAGLVINGGVRDVAANNARGFPIFAAGVCMRAADKEKPGYIGYPVVCGGVTVNADDLVLGDDDGVAAVPAERAAEVLAAAEKRAAREREIMRRLEQGELTLDIMGFRKALQRHGLDV